MNRSWVWCHFKKLNNDSAVCQVDRCAKVLKSGGSTSCLASHLKSQHKLFGSERKPENELPAQQLNYPGTSLNVEFGSALNDSLIVDFWPILRFPKSRFLTI